MNPAAVAAELQKFLYSATREAHSIRNILPESFMKLAPISRIHLQQCSQTAELPLIKQKTQSHGT